MFPLATAPVLPTVAHESLLVSVGSPVSDAGGVAGAGLDTDGFGEGFVVVRKSPGDCTAGAALAETKALLLGANTDGVDSGSGSDLKTSSNRARLKCDRSANPR